MKAYLINLAHETERLETQREQFASRGVEFERVEAKTEGELDKFRWWCAVLRPPVKGELGCAASHLECWRRLLESGEACAAVFEDDVILGPAIREALQKAEAWCCEHPRAVVLLSDHREKCCQGGNVASANTNFQLRVEKTEWDECSEGYVIGREAARTLGEKEAKTRVPIDYWGYFAKKGWIELYRAVPASCSQDKARFASSLGERYVVAGKGRRERAWWMIRRAIGKLLDI
jgi:glycosyl transferase family 25